VSPVEALNMDGKLNVGLDRVRTLAILCHALDIQFDRLFNSETICGKQPRIHEAYGRLLSENLLNLAVSIRVSLSDEADYRTHDSGIMNAGLLERKDDRNDTGRFSIKDVCDKIIHAERIYKPQEDGVQGAGCTLSGHERDQAWDLHLGVQIFCEYVLKWLEEIENRATAKGNAPAAQRSV
jgi:hypothetical protein